METDNFLTMSINCHPLSDEFLKMCTALHFKTVQHFFTWPIGHLLQLDGFTYHHYHELLNYLKKNGYRTKADRFIVCQE